MGSNGNISEDPLFCGISNGDFTLCANSSCAIENNAECGQIGARPLGCEACQTAVLQTTWGQIRIAYR